MQSLMLECEQPRLVLETPNRGLTEPPSRSRRLAGMHPTTRASSASTNNPHNMPVRVGNVLPRRDSEDVRAWLLRLRAAEHAERRGR